MFGSQSMSGSPEDANEYGAGFGNQGLPHANNHNQHRQQHIPRYPGTPCGPQDVMQGQGEYNNGGHHFHSQSPSYRPRGHPRIAPWMRPPPRFANPNGNGYGDAYGPRGFHGNHRGGGGGMPRVRDSHHYGHHFGSYRNGRRHGRLSHLQNQNYSVPINGYRNHHPVPHHEEYVPFPYSPNMHNQSYSPSNLQYLPHAYQPPNNAGHAYLPFPENNVYISPENLATVEIVDTKPADATSTALRYCSEATAADPAPTAICEKQNENTSCEVTTPTLPLKSAHALPVTSLPATLTSRRSSTASSEDGSASLCSTSSTSESSSDGFENEDSGVSTFEPSEDEKLKLAECTVAGNLAEENACQTEESEIPCNFLVDAQEFTLVYVEAKSAHVIDGKGNTSTEEASCYAVWFGPRSLKNVVEEVCGKYNQERGKTGYILGATRAVSTVKEAGNSNRVHLVMGSSFVMNNLNSWMKNLKNRSTGSTNWTEWKHMKEITELLEAIEGMVLKFTLAHPRDELFVQCREAVASRWEEMKRRRIEASNVNHSTWQVSSISED